MKAEDKLIVMSWKGVSAEEKKVIWNFIVGIGVDGKSCPQGGKINAESFQSFYEYPRSYRG